jgi:hypothetical protein
LRLALSFGQSLLFLFTAELVPISLVMNFKASNENRHPNRTPPNTPLKQSAAPRRPHHRVPLVATCRLSVPDAAAA